MYIIKRYVLLFLNELFHGASHLLQFATSPLDLQIAHLTGRAPGKDHKVGLPVGSNANICIVLWIKAPVKCMKMYSDYFTTGLR